MNRDHNIHFHHAMTQANQGVSALMDVQFGVGWGMDATHVRQCIATARKRISDALSELNAYEAQMFPLEPVKQVETA